MEEAVAVGHELNKRAEILDSLHLSGVDLTFFGKLYNGVNHLKSLVDAGLVRCRNLDITAFVDFVDRYSSTRCLLDALDDFSARADNSTDKLFGDEHGDDTRHVGLVVLTGGRNGVLYYIENMQAAVASLVEGAFKHLIAQAVALDIHLCGSDTFAGTCHLEVHVAKVVLVAENIGEDGILAGSVIGDKTHGDTADRALHLHTCIKQGEGSGAYGGHRRRTV